MRCLGGFGRPSCSPGCSILSRLLIFSLQCGEVKRQNPLPMKANTLSLLLIPLGLVCVWLSPTAQAVSPPPDGGYSNFNPAEGTDALLRLTTGGRNTAVGFNSLFSNTNGSNNTATGYQALFSNTTGNFNTANGLNALSANITGSNNNRQ